jgi:hypothetical protein
MRVDLRSIQTAEVMERPGRSGRYWRPFSFGPSEEAKLYYQGHLVMDNRHGLVVATQVTPATNTAEREVAVRLAATVRRRRRETLGADKAYDTRAFVAAVRALGLTPHVAQNSTNRRARSTGAPPATPGTR